MYTPNMAKIFKGFVHKIQAKGENQDRSTVDVVLLFAGAKGHHKPPPAGDRRLGALRESNSRPLAPEARIIPLDQTPCMPKSPNSLP